MSFTAEMFRYPGKGGWTFVTIPTEHAPDVAGPWGRTPVIATVDGRTAATSAWREKDGTWLLPIARKLRGRKEAGDTVEVEIRMDPSR